MTKSFTVSRKEVLRRDQSALRSKILRETESETQAESILRSLVRMGTDPSILFYEMALQMRTARHGGMVSGAWRVRADRGAPPPVDEPPAEESASG